MVDVPTYRGPREGSLLRAHARWILTVTLVAVVSACVLSWALQDPVYESEVRVLVNPAVTPSGAPLVPDMETERQVILSGVVAAEAARGTGTTIRRLQEESTVTVPADSTVLVLEYADTTAEDARDRAQAIADAYIVYRGAQAAVLSPATTPRSTTGPDYLLNAAAGLLLGLLLGIGSALLRDRLDDGVRGPRDLADQTGLPVLATVPLSAAGDTPPRDTSADHTADGVQLVVVDDPDSPAAEAYRQVRGRIGRAAAGPGRTTVTLVTSAAGEDGAAHVAANTAAALAAAGDGVLLVEADLRDPRLGVLFDVPAGAGLGAVLAGKVPLPEAVANSRVDGLRLLPAGIDLPSTPGKLFDEHAVQRLLSEVPAEVDHVVILAPPVLRAAETATLAARAHLLVLVAATGHTSRQDVRAALAELRDGRARLFGAVLCQGARREHGRVRPHRGFGAAAPAGPAWEGTDRTSDPPWGRHSAAEAWRDRGDRIPYAG